jgi:ribosomal protein S18 acetylase RimI-like enzyme
MNGSVRRAVLADAEAIGRVHYATHLETYTGKFPEGVIESNPPERRARMWTRIISDGVGEAWVAEREDEIVGFAGAGLSRDDNSPRELELWSIYLLAAHHGSGLGQGLLDAALGDRPASLWVLADNPRAIAFYRRNGFEPDGTERIDERYGNVRELRLLR